MQSSPCYPLRLLQGDGTAAIFRDDPSVFTLSLHCAAQPFPQQLQPSDMDVALPGGTTDEQYMQVCVRTCAASLRWQQALPACLPACQCCIVCCPLNSALPPSRHAPPPTSSLLAAALCLQVLREVLPPLMERLRPELVMYNAGVDVHGEDSLGKMSLTNAGIKQRDSFVFATCAKYGAPVAAAIGGGYEPNHEHIVDRHLLLHQAAAEHLPQLGAACSAQARAEARRQRH
jgi:acetoin utilization deacetylase AcuC-like enzyme